MDMDHDDDLPIETWGFALHCRLRMPKALVRKIGTLVCDRVPVVL